VKRQPFWKSNWFRVTVGTLISVIFLYLAVKDVPLEDVGRVLSSANYFWVLLGVFTILVQSWLRALRWILLYFPLHKGLRTWHMFAIVVISQMLNIIIPWRVGEIARIYLASEIEKQSAAQTLATLATEKAFDTLMLLLLLVAIPPFMTVALPERLEEARAGLVVITILVFVAAFVLLVFREPLIRWLDTIPFKFRGHSLADFMRKVLVSLEVFKRLDIHFYLQLLSMVMWILGAVLNYFIFLSLGLQVPVIGAFLLLAILQVGGIVPSSPGKVGVFQALCIITLALFGVGKTEGLVYGILLYLVAYGVPVVLGIIFLWYYGINLKRVTASESQ
jgi:uncharacterized protein (TIRG00374 family)